MKPIIACPVCAGNAHLKAEQKKRTYRNEKFDLVEQYYQCSKCNYSFTNDEVDSCNLNLLHNKYREKYKIPSPEQLVYIRSLYSLSQNKMSEILGFGPNQYRLYEAGDIPLGGNATVLNLIIEPMEFRNIVSKKKDTFHQSEFMQLMSKFEQVCKLDFSAMLKNKLFPKNIIPDSFTGYRLPSFQKFAHMVLFFLSIAQFKTKLNKLLSYSDLAHFKYYGSSITGSKYAAIDMGPVPDQYAIIFGLMESDGYVITEPVTINKKEVEKFVKQIDFDPNLFSDSEIEIMQTVLSTFKTKSTSVITDYSHKELAWLENVAGKSLIDYAFYAPKLLAI